MDDGGDGGRCCAVECWGSGTGGAGRGRHALRTDVAKLRRLEPISLAASDLAEPLAAVVAIRGGCLFLSGCLFLALFRST